MQKYNLNALLYGLNWAAFQELLTNDIADLLFQLFHKRQI